MAQRTTSLGGNRTVIRTKTVYDANSRVVARVDDRGAYTTYTYDALDRQLTMMFQDGSTRTNVYDLAGDVTAYTDENGSIFNMTYDPLGRKTAVTITPATGVVGTTAQSFQYDGLSRMTFARDTVGSTNTDASFAFDSLNRLVEEVQTYGGNTQYVTHDQFNSTSATDLTYPSGRQVTNGYDALYRRNSISETSGGASIAAWQFTGDRIVECVLGNGLICTQLNNARTNSMVQSPNVPNPVWGNVSSDRLGYDGSGRMIAQRYLAGGINGTTFAYNNTTSLVGFTTYYDPNGNKLFERALHAEERSALYPSYDSLNRLLEYQRGVLASGGGSISTAIMLPGTDSQRTYDLDHLGNWKNTAYTPVGGSATTEVRRHNLVNQLTKFGSTPVLYDHGNNAASSNRVVAARGNGNIADDGTRVYAYDALNRLTTVTRTSDSAQVAAYTYDAAGRRALKIVTNGGIAGTIANATYRYLYNDQQIVEELTGGNTTLRQFVWGQYIDELIQLKTYASTGTQPLPAGTYYPLQDLLYRTTALTDSSGNIVEAYDYDAYGNTLIYSGPGTDNTWFTDDDVTSLQPACEYLYTGRQYDPETEIYWYRARYYGPALGRFVSRDPIGNPSIGERTTGRDLTDDAIKAAKRKLAEILGPRFRPALQSILGYADGMNLYQYVRSNPVRGLDPSGLDDAGIGVGQYTFPSPQPFPNLLANSPDCNKYGCNDTYDGANARCFCKCAGDSQWSQYVRGCLRYLYEQKYDPGLAHSTCYDWADQLEYDKPRATLYYCYAKCLTIGNI